MGTSGWRSFMSATPSGVASKHKNLIFVAPASFNISMAAAEEFPVASIGSTAITSLSSKLLGTLK